MNFYLARQPIFDQNQLIIGYEIVYRSSLSTAGLNDIEYTEATSRLLLNSYLDVSMDTLLGGHIAFINFDRELVMNDSPLLLNCGSTIIQISASIDPDDAFIVKINQFKEDGYLIALSDYTLDYPHLEIVDMADILQINVADNSTSQLKKIIKGFINKDHLLLAKNIHDYNTYKTCLTLGYDLFQGYYFCQPTLTKGRLLQPSNYNNMEILKLINEEEPDIKLISQKIEGDVHLTIKLLRLVNSGHYFVNEISSVQHALAMIGTDAFKNWLNIALLDSFLDDQTPEIIKLSIVRMKLMESIGMESHLRGDVETLKLIGLLSVLDVLLDKNMIEAVNPLPIEKEMKMTLLGRQSQYSSLYRLVINYEKADFNKAFRDAKSANFNLDRLPDLYAEAIRWTDDIYEKIYPTSTTSTDDLMINEVQEANKE